MCSLRRAQFILIFLATLPLQSGQPFLFQLCAFAKKGAQWNCGVGLSFKRRRWGTGYQLAATRVLEDSPDVRDSELEASIPATAGLAETAAQPCRDSNHHDSKRRHAPLSLKS
ncbi:hypothetical protein EDD16DRAFT_1600135 [Pisolithus croceorrhizus]|nr:hypothetical protein EDD16DRAFT_1600135 [Pisolithus croceorrhizus]KAI6146569.1 hypothetical protein EDD17DRAFT_1651939 [Pisolithus thermaeus]